MWPLFGEERHENRMLFSSKILGWSMIVVALVGLISTPASGASRRGRAKASKGWSRHGAAFFRLLEQEFTPAAKVPTTWAQVNATAVVSVGAIANVVRLEKEELKEAMASQRHLYENVTTKQQGVPKSQAVQFIKLSYASATLLQDISPFAVLAMAHLHAKRNGTHNVWKHLGQFTMSTDTLKDVDFPPWAGKTVYRYIADIAEGQAKELKNQCIKFYYARDRTIALSPKGSYLSTNFQKRLYHLYDDLAKGLKQIMLEAINKVRLKNHYKSVVSKKMERYDEKAVFLRLAQESIHLLMLWGGMVDGIEAIATKRGLGDSSRNHAATSNNDTVVSLVDLRNVVYGRFCHANGTRVSPYPERNLTATMFNLPKQVHIPNFLLCRCISQKLEKILLRSILYDREVRLLSTYYSMVLATTRLIHRGNVSMAKEEMDFIPVKPTSIDTLRTHWHQTYLYLERQTSAINPPAVAAIEDIARRNSAIDQVADVACQDIARPNSSIDPFAVAASQETTPDARNNTTPSNSVRQDMARRNSLIDQLAAVASQVKSLDASSSCVSATISNSVRQDMARRDSLIDQLAIVASQEMPLEASSSCTNVTMGNSAATEETKNVCDDRPSQDPSATKEKCEQLVVSLMDTSDEPLIRGPPLIRRPPLKRFILRQARSQKPSQEPSSTGDTSRTQGPSRMGSRKRVPGVAKVKETRDQPKEEEQYRTSMAERLRSRKKARILA